MRAILVVAMLGVSTASAATVLTCSSPNLMDVVAQRIIEGSVSPSFEHVLRQDETASQLVSCVHGGACHLECVAGRFPAPGLGVIVSDAMLSFRHLLVLDHSGQLVALGRDFPPGNDSTLESFHLRDFDHDGRDELVTTTSFRDAGRVGESREVFSVDGKKIGPSIHVPLLCDSTHGKLSTPRGEERVRAVRERARVDEHLMPDGTVELRITRLEWTAEPPGRVDFCGQPLAVGTTRMRLVDQNFRLVR